MVKVLLESNQDVPDFLADKKPPEGEDLNFNDDSEGEEDEGAAGGDDGAGAWGAGGGDAWGAGDDAAPAAAVVESAAPAADDWNANANTGW